MNEKAFIDELLRPLVQSVEADQLRDDVASLPKSQSPQIITTDTLIEGKHFRSGDSWNHVAKKLLRVNVSDCFAKGALPAQCLLNLTWNSALPVLALEDFISGLEDDLDYYSLRLIGGDTTSHKGPVVLSLTLIGDCLATDGPVRRSGAQAGDQLWVTGTIGDAYLGLSCATPKSDDEAALNERYLVPNLPHRSVSKLVADYATASMDVSDGLLSDALHLADASGKKLSLNMDLIPLSPEAERVLDTLQTSRTALLNGGDDYQVLFTSRAEAASTIEDYAAANGLALTRIGTVRDGAGVECLENGTNIFDSLKTGWEHSLSD